MSDTTETEKNQTTLSQFAELGHHCYSWTLGSKTRDIHEFNPEDYRDWLLARGAEAIVIGVERGSTGYKHWQCAAQFADPKLFAEVQERWNDFIPGKIKHHEKKTKKWFNAWNYCRKEGKAIVVNTMVQQTSAGARETATEVNAMIQAGHSLREINKMHPVYVMYNLDKLEKYAGWLRGDYKRGRWVCDDCASDA